MKSGGVGRGRSAKDFDGDIAAESRIAGAIDFAHPAGAERRDDFVGAEARPWCQHWIGLAGDDRRVRLYHRHRSRPGITIRT
jgi:hypothetical protein